LVHLTARYIKFVSPEIVRRIVSDNDKNRSEWSAKLLGRDVDPQIYLWDGSPCAFPGVRRYAGSKEIAYFRKHTELKDAEITGAVQLDDNSFPKQIWSHVFLGKKFANAGPGGYALAHLADHKEHKNRADEEFELPSAEHKHPLYGLFTCPTNTAYIPNSLIRPTDFSPVIRRLLISRANALYGDFCQILPQWMRLKPAQENWDHRDFQWGETVGELDHVNDFLKFRTETMEKIFKT